MITHLKDGYVKISTLYICKFARNKGIGSYILEKELKHWKNNGIRNFIVTLSEKAIKEIPYLYKFFVNFDFQIISKLENRYIQGFNELILLRKDNITDIL